MFYSRVLREVHTFEFLPAMPPSTVSGNVMRAQMTRMMQMVPNGNAAVDCAHPTPQESVCLAVDRVRTQK